MTRDCRCHRLFYPYFIGSRSANSVNTLKTKTTISPVRKNCAELFPRWKLPNSNLTINQLLSPSRKRTFPLASIDYDQLGDADFNRVDAFFDEASHSIHLDTNSITMRSSPDKVNAMRPQHYYSRRVSMGFNSSRISSNIGKFTNDRTGYETSKNSPQGIGQQESFQEKENYNNFTTTSNGTRDFESEGANWKATYIEKDRDSNSLRSRPGTEVAEMIEDYEQFIFNMSPFTSSQPCLVFTTTSDYSEQRNNSSLDDFNISGPQNDDDDPDQDDVVDEDERSISITSVLPIDIPQPQKSI